LVDITAICGQIASEIGKLASRGAVIPGLICKGWLYISVAIDKSLNGTSFSAAGNYCEFAGDITLSLLIRVD
jgi:hypothetical protein